MSCLCPTQAWQDLYTRKLVWSFKELDQSTGFWRDGNFISTRYKPLVIPCGKCVLCKKARSWELTIRALMEFQALPPDRKKGCFVTLTVSDEFMPEVFPGMVLRHKPFQDFMKRLRRKCERELYGYDGSTPKLYRRSLRYLMCGEYGERSRRPHYHVCFFGEDFTEQSKFVRDGYAFTSPAARWYRDGSRCESSFIAECWPFGNIMCRPLNDNAIAYTAGYALKLDPVEQDRQSESYEDFWEAILRQDEITVDSRLHNYCKWSRRPGLGFNYMQKYPSLFRQQEEIMPDGYCVPSICPSIIYNGRQVFFDGRYFKTKLQVTDREKYDKMKSLSDSRAILKQVHNLDSAAECRALNLKNRAAMINQKLARKERDIGRSNVVA